MKCKAILLDIDNTLYPYLPTHEKAVKVMLDFLAEQTGIGQIELDEHYQAARKAINQELHGSAASHNRLLYIQRMLEKLDKNPVSHKAFEAYQIYWSVFISNIELFDGVREFFKSLAGTVKFGFVTDLTADVQHQKLIGMGLADYVDALVTSEEAGVEKPAIDMFEKVLFKLHVEPKDVYMIGDNYIRDILGALALGIKSIWINHDQAEQDVDKKLIQVVQRFDQIQPLIK